MQVLKRLQKMFKLDLGCGNRKQDNCVGLDLRKTEQTDIVGDMLSLPVAKESIDVVECSQTLEHFTLTNIYLILDGIWEILKPDGQLIVAVPNFGTYSAICDKDHKFITDLAHWEGILRGYFKSVRVKPYGVRFQSVSEKWKQKQEEMIVDGFYDLAQGFDFICKIKKAFEDLSRAYIPWDLENNIQCQLI